MFLVILTGMEAANQYPAQKSEAISLKSRGMERLVMTVQELSLARDLETVMRIVRKVARELTGADGATFVLRENGYCYYADEDAIAPLWKGHRFPIETCISGWTMMNKRAAVIPDIYNDDRIPISAYKPTFVKSLAMVPIRTIDPIAAIGNYWAQKHVPTTEQLELLQALADITAVTMENVSVYAELEQRVADRTAQLEKLNKELESFSYSVSHDLRAPLRAIRSYSKILIAEHASTLDDEGKRLLNNVVNSGNNMNQLIDDLLTFSRAGRKELEKTLVNMQEMATEIWLQCKEQNADRIIDCTISEMPVIPADAATIKQVWANLVSNAVKYSGNKGMAIIEVGAETTANEVVYYVKDNGAGFDMRYADKLFGVFQRLHSQQEFEGTGIGLALVQTIINKHGGNVWADAKLNEGATFYFSLPL